MVNNHERIVQNNLEFLAKNLRKKALEGRQYDGRTFVYLSHDEWGRLSPFQEGRNSGMVADYEVCAYRNSFLIQKVTYSPKTRNNGIINLRLSAERYNVILGLPTREATPIMQRR